MRIVIINAHWNNRGDEAAHRPLWKELQRLYPDAQFTVLIKDKKSVESFPDLRNFRAVVGQFKAAPSAIWLAVLSRGLLCSNTVLKKSVQILKEADLIIYPPGGSVINGRFYWSKQMEYLMPFLCARIYGIPMAVCSPSMGPFNDKPRRRIRKWLLRTPEVFCVREDISRRYLVEADIRDEVTVTMDLAFMDDVDDDAEAVKMKDYPDLSEFLDGYDKVVGITISDFKWHVKLGKDAKLSQRIESSFREFITWLTEQGFGVLLIPQLFGNQNDIDDLREFEALGVHVMSDQPDTYLQQHVIGRLYAVIGMRYHSNIFAAKMGTPFIAIPYEEKMKGFLELAGLTDQMLTLDQVNVGALKSSFQKLEANHDQLRSTLREQRHDWRSRARKTVDALSQLA